MSITSSQSIRTAGVTLGAFALFAVILLASVQWLTKDSIAENIRQQRLQRLHDIIPENAYDNDLLASVVEQNIRREGLANTLKIYTAALDGTKIASVFEVTSLKGYSGAINLLVGINHADNSLRGVRVVSHKETPGLGDKIETKKDDWILQFAGKSLRDPSLAQWKVKKDGGVFDQFTGATITPRAVVNAVRETLILSAEKLATHE